MINVLLEPCDPNAVWTCLPGGGLIGTLPGAVTGSLAGSAWEAVCRSFAEAAVGMLGAFAEAFGTFPGLTIESDRFDSIWGMSLGIAMVVAVLLLFMQVARTAFTHDGRGIAEALVGIGKAALACLLVLTISAAALAASDQLTQWIIDGTFESTQGLVDELTAIMPDDPNMSMSLLLILAVVGICLVAVLWFELLLRNAAIAVLIATSPIAAAGQTSEVTKAWWSKLVQATIQLIILKPVIALCFAIGFTIMDDAEGEIATMLSGMLVLLLAALAWPAIGKFMTFTQSHVSGGAGLAGLLGFAAGSASKLSSSKGGTAGVSPEAFGQASEERTMSAVNARAGSMTGTKSAGAAGGAAALGPAAIAALGLQLAQAGANQLTKGMESTAGHAGMRHNPHIHPAGTPSGGGVVAGGAAMWQASTHTQASTATVEVSHAPDSPAITYNPDGYLAHEAAHERFDGSPPEHG
ncbi:hypothetical protein [Phytomonospora endophytica]|uniref:Conjugal transfer protein TrbL n=1 Tax=Phytomonospora endophytica TaxID=714109 RepID=A0A841FWH4_9ACTN|nr:hypothetical protein [Phytomonospora endophytica]MBB6037687.1 hypothetical protein [Phytomonospora endophytica]GIG67786.1 hypothetical protein Pen01_40810 [Phytomonospora endophytica]